MVGFTFSIRNFFHRSWILLFALLVFSSQSCSRSSSGFNTQPRTLPDITGVSASFNQKTLTLTGGNLNLVTAAHISQSPYAATMNIVSQTASQLVLSFAQNFTYNVGTQLILGLDIASAQITQNIFMTVVVTTDWNGNNLTNIALLGVGTTAPDSKLTVSANAATLQAPSAPGTTATTLGHFGGADTANSRVMIDAYGGIPYLDFRRADGTAAAPSAIQSGDYIGAIGFSGYDSAYSATRAQITAVAAETWAAANHGTLLAFNTTANGNNTASEKMRLDGSGNLMLSTTSPQANYLLTVNGGIYSTVATVNNAVYGLNSSTGAGVYGDNSSTGTGVYGASVSTGKGVYGLNSSTGYGVYGQNSSTGIGVYGVNASSGQGVFGDNTSTGAGVYGRNSSSGNAITGSNTGTGYGVAGTAVANGIAAVIGTSSNAGGYGVQATNSSGAGNSIGLYASSGNASGYAIYTNTGYGYFTGNVGIGAGATVPSTALQVGGQITPAVDNTYKLGDAALRFTTIYASNNVINTSDLREKKEIEESDLGLEFVRKLRPVSYYWKSGADKEQHFGFIAQEVEKTLKESGKVDSLPIVDIDGKTKRYGLRYTEFIAPIVKSIQDLYGLFEKIFRIQSDHENEIRNLNSEINKLKAENLALKNSISVIDSKLNELSLRIQK